MEPVWVAVLTSGAVFSFIQFLIALAFSRKDKMKDLEAKFDELNEKIDENQAINARVHLLRFADELRRGSVHSMEYFKQTLLDASHYEHYCETHPNFSNGITEISINFIKEKYKEELEKAPEETKRKEKKA